MILPALSKLATYYEGFWGCPDPPGNNLLQNCYGHISVSDLVLSQIEQMNTEDIGYYDYRPVTLLFACFIVSNAML